jgi:hypothetical protein
MSRAFHVWEVVRPVASVAFSSRSASSTTTLLA